MAAGDLLKLIVNQTMNSEKVQNVLYYEVKSDDTIEGNEKALGAGFISAVIAPVWAPLFSNEVSYDCVSVQKVFPLPVGAIQDFNVALQGGRPGEGLPATDAALIQKFNPAVGGKGKKGRVYLAGLEKTDEDLGRITSAILGGLQALAASMQANATSAGGGDYEPAWAIRAPVSPFGISGFVNGLIFDVLPRIATQRRRRTPVRATS